ncbi:unnamed protein product [Vitrella brassicaformis CCMP3155]|uniref:Thioester reductase (TE) domain-containing protein n=1 Tax=Vitrella brassicaformis (strain CCMP3155) TaxID=1169540 RepID=A0A0G4EQ99_VITBC|nr:unnamed protein product [Vitrella brassicaformis CCMP3155]|eukprot:CEL99794.1 unnamed protein product [Vitrella brassicaformis CCMP3155]
MAVEESGHFPLCGGGAADSATGGESRRSRENGCCLRAIQDSQLAKALFHLTGRLAPCPQDSSLAPRPLDDAKSHYRVFVTGATGFLGSHQLVSLLKTGRIEEVCCFVRARDGHTALQRLQAALSSHGLSLSADQWARVKPVSGDLSRPSFGLDGDAFATLAAGRFHALYHFAAIDNFFLGWDELAAVNVGGLMDVIRFAWGSGGAGGRLPVVFYAGSCAARLHDVYRAVADEADGRPPRRLGLYNNYGYTKWLGRELLRWFARRGFPAVHYDIGYVARVGADDTFTSLTNGDSLEALLKFTLDSEVMLLDDLPLDLTCPDYLAHAITLHSMDVLATGRQSAFDLQMRNPHTISLHGDVLPVYRDLCGNLTFERSVGVREALHRHYANTKELVGSTLELFLDTITEHLPKQVEVLFAVDPSRVYRHPQLNCYKPQFSDLRAFLHHLKTRVQFPSSHWGPAVAN